MNQIQQILYKKIIINGEKKQDVAAEFGIARETLNRLIREGIIRSFEVTGEISSRTGIPANVLCGIQEKDIDKICNDCNGKLKMIKNENCFRCEDCGKDWQLYKPDEFMQ